ncbi:MAG: 23S rRNA (uracil(1939)-C(5))-methyltransferase RlmD [Deltaproteobacteria bacterium]|jgi:23S rRNA (uracil1939-C5)-methyltransferase|nr:23S rRNA (uracil(1939)-C(5))-methyltransferase RlmD [Deltaproteobacteria bacterium]
MQTRRSTKKTPASHAGHRPSELCLTIEDVNKEGLGIAHSHGRLVLVFDALPGERLKVRVDHFGENRIIATTLRVLKPSKSRTSANPCPHFRSCQGCPLLSWDGSAQLDFKTDTLITALKRYPELAELTPADIWAAPQTVGYRASAKLAVSRDFGKTRIGLYRRHSHAVTDISACPVHHPLINKIVKIVQEQMDQIGVLPFNPHDGSGLLRYVLVRINPLQKKAMVTFVTAERNYRELTRLAKKLQQKAPEVVSIHQNINASSGNVILGRDTVRLMGFPDLVDQVGDVRLRLGPTSFLQVHHAQAAKIYRLVRQWSECRAGESALDLYCGVGGISLHLASVAGQVVGIEVVTEAARHAQANARLNGFDNCQFFAGDVAKLLNSNLKLPGRFGTVVLNPPRSGCDDQVLAGVAQLRPRTLIYVSCHPETLARDLAQLHKYGFQVAELQPVDMFPQTPHIETVARLVAR